LSAIFWKFGRRPSRISFAVMPGSMPSSPRITTRFTCAFLYGLPTRILRQAKLIGQIRSVPTARKKVVISAKREPTKAKPAPGPM
jgi:hypothetical protein